MWIGFGAVLLSLLGVLAVTGYAGAQVQAGKTVTVRVTRDRRMFRRWDETADAWEDLRNGELLIARGLRDIQARLP